MIDHHKLIMMEVDIVLLVSFSISYMYIHCIVYLILCDYSDYDVWLRNVTINNRLKEYM